MTPDALALALSAVVVVDTGGAYCSGAGVQFSEVKLVVTAYHCVADGGRPNLRWRDGTERRGKVIARAPEFDFALIAVDGEFPVLRVRPSAVAQGEQVWGLGHPFGLLAGGKFAGLLEWSASRGVVSGVSERFIQTDAALNPGNSGGPLVDDEGYIVGVVSRKLRAENLAFATMILQVVDRVTNPDRGPSLGGSVHLGLVASVGTTPWLGATADVRVRERMVVEGGLGLDFEGQPHWSGAVLGRQRLGSAGLSAAVDLGVRVEGTTVPTLPGFGVRLGLNQTTIGGWWHPWTGTGVVTIGVGWPGKLGVF